MERGEGSTESGWVGGERTYGERLGGREEERGSIERVWDKEDDQQREAEGTEGRGEGEQRNSSKERVTQRKKEENEAENK